MKIMHTPDEPVILALTIDELSIVNNALNEVLEFLGEAEFQTRMGADAETVSALLDQVYDAYQAASGAAPGAS